ncbi:MAG TPA: hypothetical protein VE010_06375, partial [Thermoanaerobaculia bacterium]|nr:hypothetical protein [Thermoanaerobaculia bacterium]
MQRIHTVAVLLLCLIAAGLQAATPTTDVSSEYIVTVAKEVKNVEAAARALAADYDGTVLAVWPEPGLRAFWVRIASKPDALRMKKDSRVARIERNALYETSGVDPTSDTPTTTVEPYPQPGGYAAAFRPRVLWHLDRISHRMRQEASSNPQYNYPVCQRCADGY